MSTREPVVVQQDDSSISGTSCPGWCVAGHGANLGEEDWLHTSEPVRIIDGLPAQLVMSIDPSTGEVDGPYVLIRDTELTLAEVSALATSLSTLVTMAAAREGVGEQGHNRAR